MDGKDKNFHIPSKSINRNSPFNYLAGMFTGIIESMATVADHSIEGTNHLFWLESPLSAELRIDQSVSHNGVCLTVDDLKPGMHRVTAIAETLTKTNLGKLRKGQSVNLERCMQLNGRLDGHIVQGHVDATGTIASLSNQDGSWLFTLSYPEQFAPLLIEKGSICLNGISLTVFNVGISQFSVAIIPYTYTHTNLGNLSVGDPVNLEFDILGKYIQRNIDLRLQDTNLMKHG